MSIYITIPDLAYWLLVSFMAGVYIALATDDDRGAFDEPQAIIDERRRVA